jgi:hypothetical protein
MDLNLEAQAILPAAEVRDECQESQHKGDGKKQCCQPTEEPKPGEGHHGWNRGTQPASLHVEGPCDVGDVRSRRVTGVTRPPSAHRVRVFPSVG